MSLDTPHRWDGDTLITIGAIYIIARTFRDEEPTP